MPEREKIGAISEQLGLSVNQIYKWFWDTKKKVEEHTALARSIGQMPNVVDTDEFGGYSTKKDFLIEVDGKNGRGEKLTAHEIKHALKTNQLAAVRDCEFESIARTLNLQIDKIALDIVSLSSPTGTRQIVKSIDTAVFN